MIWPSKVGMVGLSIKKNRKSISSQKNSKKGFTLVELIVVLVILAILAAFSVPALLGYIDYTKNKKLITEAESAMSATETMLSDAYTDGLKYLPRRVRDSALATSGLADTTEFVIKTVDSFQLADGTYKSMKSYTVSTALYKAEDGSYVYFDGSDWRVLDNEADGDKTIIAGQTTGNNYIVVWPSGSEKAATDSASSDNNSVAKDDNDETVITIDTEDEESKIDDHNDGQEDTTEGDNPVIAYDSVTLILRGAVDSTEMDNVRFIDGNSGKLSGANSKVVEFTGGSDTFTTTYTENESGSGDLETTPSFTCANNDLLDQGEIEWVNSSDSSIVKPDINGVCSYLDEVVNDDSITEVTFIARVKEKSLNNIPISFLPYDKTTQSVEVIDGVSDKDGDGKNDTVNAEYGLVSEAVVCNLDTNDVSVEQVNKGAGNEGAITFDNNWAIKDPAGGTSAGGGPECIKNSDESYYKASISDVTNIIPERVKGILDSDGDDNITSDEIEANKSKCSVVFYAPADINKTLYVRGKVENNQYVGIVSFDKAKQYSFEESFVKNELDGDIYKKSDTTKQNPLSFEGDGAYSIFSDHSMIMSDASMKVKWWYLYKCNLKMSSAELMNESVLTSDDKTRAKDLNNTGTVADTDFSKLLINDKLYKKGNEKYGELAVVDVSGITTMFQKTRNDNEQTPIRGLLREVAETKADYIRSINYIAYDLAEKNPDNVCREVCLSSTLLKTTSDGKLERDEDGNVIVTKYDNDYPAYTVAYSLRYDNPNASADGYPYIYDIYVYTEDDTDIKVKGSLKQFNYNFLRLNNSDLHSNLETSEVKNMDSMFNGCKALTSIDASGLEGDSATNLTKMFMDCSNLTSVNLSGFNAVSATNMSHMFRNCPQLTSINLSGFNSVSATDMSNMFRDCSQLTSIEWDGFRTSSVTTMMEMFRGCKQITDLDLSCFDTSNVENMSYMIYDCPNLETVNVSTFDTENVKTMYCMFGNPMGIYNNSLKELDLTSFKTSKNNLETIRDMFIRCQSLKTIYVDATQWDTSMFDYSGRDATGGNTFKECHSLVGGNGTSHPNSGMDEVTDSSLYAIADEPDGMDLNGNGIEGEDGYFTDSKKAMFMSIIMNDSTATSWIDELGLSTSFVNMKGFQKYPGNDMTAEKALALGAKPINDTTYKPEGQDEVISIYGWFDSNGVFNWWSEAQVVYLNPQTEGMFNFYYGKKTGLNTQLAYVDFGGIDMSKMTTFKRFFSNCINLERIYDGKGTGRDYSFVSDNVTSMFSMFSGCNRLKSVDFSKCNTSNVTDMSEMFMDVASMTEIDLSSFSSESLTTTHAMFSMRSGKNMTIDGVSKKISEVNQLKTIKFGKDFTCENVSLMTSMFSECRKLETLDLRYFNSVKQGQHVNLNVSNMFFNCINLKTIITSDPASNDGKGFTTKIQDYNTRINSSGNMFAGCSSLVGGDGTSTVSSLGNKTDATYAKIGKNGQQGLFTKAE